MAGFPEDTGFALAREHDAGRCANSAFFASKLNCHEVSLPAMSAKEIETRRRAFLRKWRPRCRAVADNLEEAGERLFSFVRLPESQWKSARTTNAVERLHEEFKRRIKTQTVLPSAETAAMLFWAEVVQRFQRAAGSVEGPPEGLLASGRDPHAQSGSLEDASREAHLSMH